MGGDGDKSSKSISFTANCLLTEVDLLKKINHPNIVANKGAHLSIKRQKLFIFMEYVAGGTIRDSLKKYRPMQPGVAQRYASDILDGLQYLHDASIIHRDIKPANILIDDGRCKIADLGTCKIIEKHVGVQNTFKVGTMLYAPPEMHIDGAHLTPAFDVWSFAVTLHVMRTGENPWPADYKRTLRDLVYYMTSVVISEGVPALDSPLLDTHARDLMTWMLQVDAADRPMVSELRQHPFFHQEYEIVAPSTSTDVVNKLSKIRDCLPVTPSLTTVALDPFPSCQADQHATLTVTDTAD